MNPDTTSIWSSAKTTLSGIPLVRDASYDVCVVGGGIAGLTTAYLLAGEGKRVVVLDAKPAVASGESEFTTAHLAWYADNRFAHLASVRGDAVAKAAATSHRAAIDAIGAIARTENIDCDYMRVDGHLVAGRDGSTLLDEEVHVLERLGLSFERANFAFPGGRVTECLRFPDHGQFHPIKYLVGLVAAIRTRGGIVHTDTVVDNVRGGAPCSVTTTHGRTIAADSVVVATNNPFEGGTLLHSKVAAYTTYAFAAEIPRGALGSGLYWDTEDPYHYIRLQPGETDSNLDYLIVGGEDHKTGQASDQPQRWERLKAWTKDRFPSLGAIRHHWSGQVFETPDGLALIGLAPWNGPNVFVVTGDSGMGMTHGTLGGHLLADLVMGRTNELAEVYSPSRMMPAALRTLLGENLNTIAQFGDWLTGGDVTSVDEIPRGQGAVLRSGVTKLAIFKDGQGVVSARSAVCPHMGAVVRWNPGERTWDCPCHGSRFDAAGKCLHGPSTTDLKSAAAP